MVDRLIVDPSAMVDLLVGSPQGIAIGARIRGHDLHVPAHFDAEVFSTLGRLERAGALTARQVKERIERLEVAPMRRHLLPPLLSGSWRRRHNLRLVDALYVELAHQLESPIITTDAGLAAASSAVELITI